MSAYEYQQLIIMNDTYNLFKISVLHQSSARWNYLNLNKDEDDILYCSFYNTYVEYFSLLSVFLYFICQKTNKHF